MALSAQSEWAADCTLPMTYYSSLLSGNYWLPLSPIFTLKIKCEPKSKFELNSPEVEGKNSVLCFTLKCLQALQLQPFRKQPPVFIMLPNTAVYYNLQEGHIYKKSRVRNRTGNTSLDELEVVFISETKTLKSLNQK